MLRRDMGKGMKKYLAEQHVLEVNSIEIQIIIEAYIGAVLGVLNWWIENNMSIAEEEIYTKMKIFSGWNFGD